jgi:predicted neuraminidase
LIFSLENRPTPECHASTIAESGPVLVAAWFGGLHEKHDSVGIWLSRRDYDGHDWSAPVEVANGNQPDGNRLPCWNPVLFQPSDGPLLLFYKIGATIAGWQTMMQVSTDHGISWAEPVQLENPVMGPVKNKPIELADGTLLYGGSNEPSWDNWQVYFSRSRQSEVNAGFDWELIGPCNRVAEFQAIQPTLFQVEDRIVAFCRTRQGCISQTSSTDNGESWSAMTSTALPNPNAGIDGITSRSGRHYLVYNPVLEGRSPLVVAASDDLEEWHTIKILEAEPGEYSYPAIMEDSQGVLQITYTWRRQCIQHISLAV